MILIFDLYGGLCNQFYDLNSSINFCLKYSINFTFRYCCFRKKNLNDFFLIPYENLFDLTNIIESNKEIKKLYIEFNNIKSKINNTNLYDSNKRCIEIFKKENLLEQFKNINKEFIILKQFWSLNSNIDLINIFKYIQPNKKLYNIYNSIKKELPEKYNCIHYRFEKDFIYHFKCDIINLDKLLNNKQLFKNNNLNIYISVSNIYECLNIDNLKIEYGYNNYRYDVSSICKENKIIPSGDINRFNLFRIDPFYGIKKSIFIDDVEYNEDVEIDLLKIKYSNILYKNDKYIKNLNFEEKAFIDFLICFNSVEFIGNKLSSFSYVLNFIKHTNNNYN